MGARTRNLFGEGVFWKYLSNIMESSMQCNQHDDVDSQIGSHSWFFCVCVGQAMVLIISDNPAIVAIVHDNYKA